METGPRLITPVCIHCASTTVKIRRQIISNSGVLYAWRCMECGRWAESPPRWIKHGIIAALARHWKMTPDDIPLIEDSGTTNQQTYAF
jgi:hypothetical protein